VVEGQAQAEAEPPMSELPLATWPIGSSSVVGVVGLAEQPSTVRIPQQSVACVVEPGAAQVARRRHSLLVILSASHPRSSLPARAEPRQRAAQEVLPPKGTAVVVLVSVEVEAASVAAAVAAATSVGAEGLAPPSALGDRPKLDLAEADRDLSRVVAQALRVPPALTPAMAR
jgi:hypothetical protein